MWYSAFIEESVLRERFAIVSPPSRKVGIGVCFDISEIIQVVDTLRMNQGDARINVLSSWEVLWVASNIACIRRLVHSYIVDSHMGWKWKMIEIDDPKVSRHAQVHYDVLVR